jgi:hypothetical protein
MWPNTEDNQLMSKLKQYQYVTFDSAVGLEVDSEWAVDMYALAEDLQYRILDDGTTDLLAVSVQPDEDADFLVVPGDVFLELVKHRRGNWVSIHDTDGMPTYDDAYSDLLMTPREYLNTFVEGVEFFTVFVRWEGTETWERYEFSDSMVESDYESDAEAA